MPHGSRENRVDRSRTNEAQSRDGQSGGEDLADRRLCEGLKEKRRRRHEEDESREELLAVGAKNMEVGKEEPEGDDGPEGGEPGQHSLHGVELSRGRLRGR